MKTTLRRNKPAKLQPDTPEDAFIIFSRILIVLYALFIISIALRSYAPHLLP